MPLPSPKGLLPAPKWAGPEAETATCGHVMGPGHPRAKQRQPETPGLLLFFFPFFSPMFVIAAETQAKGGKTKKLSGFPVSARTVAEVNLEEEIRIRQK